MPATPRTFDTAVDFTAAGPTGGLFAIPAPLDDNNPVEIERLAYIQWTRRLSGRKSSPWLLESGWRIIDPAAEKRNRDILYAERRRSGLCTTCGKAADGASLCAACKALGKSARKQKQTLTRAAGLCKCGETLPDTGHKACYQCRRKTALRRRKKRK